MKQYLKSIIALTAICAVVAVLLSVANFITAPIIKENEAAAANESLKVVMPDGEDFKSVDISGYSLPKTITEVFSEKNGGYVFKLSTSGYSANMIIMCGVDNSGKVTGSVCIGSEETLGYESTYGEKFKGITSDTVESVDTISGATKTTLGYRNAVKDALNGFIIMSGGSVDIRDEATILADNLNTALPAANGKFNPVFITEELENISAVYSAENGTGYVFVSGENFVATDSNGNVISQADDALITLISSQAKKVIDSKLTEIDLSTYANMPSSVLKAYKTSSGNYLFEVRAAGYGINGDYHASGEYIMIKASATPNGKIIDCVTVSQKETDKIGSACADKKFYSQFNGKDESNYKDIDAISGATITTNGYKTAIAKIFEAIKILKGEA